jgi:translocation and assembly module TamB
MRRAAKWIGWILAVLIGVPIVLVIVVLIGANTGPGRRAIERLTPKLTGDTVRLAGISGRFPDALRVAHVDLRDPGGDYATADDLSLDWSPMQLLHRTIVIDRLAAAHIDVMRMPASSSSTSSNSYSLPAPVVLRDLQVARVDVGAPIAGTAAAMAVNGSGELTTLTQGHVALTVQQLDGSGSYVLNGTSDATGLHATLHASEPAHGLLSGIAGLPDLGAVTLDGRMDGPPNTVATHVALTAGPLHAAADGTVDLQDAAADLTVSATAPAMHPRADLAWQSISFDAHVTGPFTRPDATGQLRIDGLASAGASIGSVTAGISGNTGQIKVDGEVTGLRLPGPNPDLLAGDPLVIQADARLDQADRPVHITLRHKMFTADADVLTGDTRRIDATMTLADLAPFAAMGKVDLQGGLTLALHAAMHGDATTIALDGTVGVTGGLQQARSLVGDSGQFRLAATMRGRDLTLSELRFTGQSVALSANGAVANDRADLNWTLGVTDLAAAEPTLAGQLQATGKVSGPTDDLAFTAAINGGVAARGMSSGALTVNIDAHGLPHNPSARITAQGALLDAPLDFAVALQRRDNGLAIDIERATWKSLQAGGSLQMPTSTMVPAGTLHIAMTRLADLAPLVGRPLAGSLIADLVASPDKAHVTAQLNNADVTGTAAASRIALVADVDQPESHPTLNATLDVDGVRAANIGGTLRMTAKGPADALALKLTASLPDLHGAPAQLNAAATLDTVGRTLNVASLQGEWRKQGIRLLAPVRIGFSDGVSIDRLRLGVRQAVLDVSGHAGTTLDLTATVRNLPADLAAVVSPAYAADGMLQADARITGTSAHPVGKVKLAATELRVKSGAGRAMPPASITANADLNGTDARIDARLSAGTSRLTVTGRVPLTAVGAIDLRAGGTLDLAVFDPVLTANGRRVRGQVSLDATIAGTAAAPRVAGTIQLAGGEVQDFETGIHLTDITARIQGSGDTVRLVQFSAKAGSGSISGSGSIGVLAPELPIDLTLTARNARPLASDLINAVLDANLTVRGQLTSQLTLGGNVRVQRADIRVPERLPASIAQLPVQQPGATPAPSAPPAAPMQIVLNLTLDAPQQVFIRGRGLDLEFGGSMKITGTASQPRTLGALEMRRGTLSLAGRTLDFSEGQITFNGGSITNPALHLVASSTNGNVTATLTVGGTALDPKILLTSVPDLPQDEVLAHLLFGSGIGRLGPFEIAGIAAGLATLTGTGGSVIGDPLDKVRQGLGLDRLAIGSGSTGSPTLEAGRYLAPGVYLGAKQSASGSGTQAEVQIDITKGLKLQGTAGTGTSSAVGAAGESNGTGLGVTYQFEY